MSDKKPEYLYTGVAATDAVERSMREAYNVPMIMVGGSMPPEPWAVVHAAAIAAGLPEIPGHYGYDFERHEFIRLHAAAIAPPRGPDVVRLLDMLGHPKLKVSVPHRSRSELAKIELDPSDAFDARDLLSALKSYRASLVTVETRRAAELAASDAARAQEAMKRALDALPDDMREEVKLAAFPEKRW